MADISMADVDAGDQPWDAQQYEAALAHLERLQEQVDGLRSALPSCVTPLLHSDSSRQQMFTNVKKAAVASSNDLKTLRESWASEETQQLLSRSKESLRKDGDLSKANDVARYGWLKGE
ncbi:hypothetical protein LTR10_006044 [Elasticomyces elasticus]|nr:hypothetical protein LTR10_006044 [Elasticomyces elasticus]KAK4966899.1 hypothetical protein LTR42_011213 [Elasticomyces elasticus]